VRWLIRALASALPTAGRAISAHGGNLVCGAQSGNSALGDPWEETMLYELRIYRCVPGRLPALLKRFEEATLKIWEKHGIRQAGFWTVLIGDGNHDLYYMLRWESLAEREKKWPAFMADAAWIKARADSERDGPIVANVTNMIVQPTTFSAVS
jgi:hypothetical protein